jgi:hypothetical protein
MPEQHEGSSKVGPHFLQLMYDYRLPEEAVWKLHV